MKTKLIKLSDTHYIVVDDSEIKEGDYKWHRIKGIIKATCGGAYTNEFKITHSTLPLGFLQEKGITTANLKHDWGNVKPLSLSEVEETIHGYSVEKMAEQRFPDDGVHHNRHWQEIGFIKGFKAHQELTKDKLFTVNDMRNMFILGGKHKLQNPNKFPEKIEEIIQSLLPKTEWDIEFDKNGKIKLL